MRKKNERHKLLPLENMFLIDWLSIGVGGKVRVTRFLFICLYEMSVHNGEMTFNMSL